MSVRTYIKLITLAVLAVAAFGFFSSIEPESKYASKLDTCGSAFSSSESVEAGRYARAGFDHDFNQGEKWINPVSWESACADRLSARRAWTLPLGAVGLVAFIGAVSVRVKEDAG